MMDWKQRSHEYYGTGGQLACAAEEFCEAAAVCARLLNGKRDPTELVDELADVRVMIEQLEHIYGIAPAVQERRQFKIDRLMSRLARGELTRSPNPTTGSTQ